MTTSWVLWRKFDCFCSRCHHDLLSPRSTPTASAHYLIFSTHAPTSTHFHVIECFLGGLCASAERSLLPHCFLFSEHSSEENETSCFSPRPQISSKSHRPQQKRCFSWRSRSQQSISQTTESSHPRSHWRLITQLSLVRPFIWCTDHSFT